MTPNQIVAYNLRRAREEHGLTQEQAAERLEPMLGERWSKALFSNAERSVDGRRIRPFSADELLAFARAFDRPVPWFFLPPSRAQSVTTPDGFVDPEPYLEVLFAERDGRGYPTMAARVAELMPKRHRAWGQMQEKVERYATTVERRLLQNHFHEFVEAGSIMHDMADRLIQVASESPATVEEEK